MSYKKLAVLFIVLIILAGCSSMQQSPMLKSEESKERSFDIKNSEQMLVIFVADRETVKNLVPAPLVVTPYNLMVVYVSRTPMGNNSFSQDMSLGILTLYNGKIYMYPVYHVVDNKEVSEMGRMITGSPTKIARINLEKKDKTVIASVEREGKILFKASMLLGENGKPLDNSLVVNLKVIKKNEGAQPEIKQLIIGKIEPVKIHELIDGEPTMEFDQSLTDNFPKVSVRSIYRSVYRKADYTITDMGILYDYLKVKE